MNARFRRHLALIAVALLIVTFETGTSCAQDKITTDQIAFRAATAHDPGAEVRGELRIPETGRERVPAILVLHSLGGLIEPTGKAYIEPLNRAGIATLEIDMFPRGVRPQSTRVTMPHGYGSLLYLASHPRIDPQRIGVIGFSWGGIMALLMASDEVTKQYAGGKAKFAAHIPVYPVCWAHLTIVTGKNRFYGPETYRRVTGASVHILTGEYDEYDDPDSCPKLVAALPEEVRKHFGVTVYPRAYHGFDEPGADRQYADPAARKGAGGRVTHREHPEAGKKARQFAVEFFQKHLGVQ
jgi:dienelactone hydrolase